MKITLALIGAVALALTGCSGKNEAAQNAHENLETAASNTASNLEDVASNMPDAAQANAVVNEAVGLVNTGEAADRADANASKPARAK